MREWAITHDKGYVVTILLHVSYIVSVAVGILLGSTTISFMSLSSVAFYAVYSAMTSVYTLSLYMIGKFLYLVLTDSFETFNAKIKISDSMYGTKRAKQVNILFEVEPRTKASVAPADHTASSESHVGLGSLLEGPREAQVPGESEANAMRELSRKVVHVHECQLLINRYFGLPSLVITSLSVTWIIHDTYSLIQDTDNTSASWELLLYILYSISVLVILCCVGEEARGKVNSMRFVVSRYRTATSDPELEKQLTYLLDLLHLFPDFRVMDFYTASKARLVDISSFIATYLVILMQFRTSEQSFAE